MNIQSRFEYITHLIAQSKQRASQAVNTELISLYWEIGKYLYEQIENEGWGKSVVKQLSEHLKQTQPNLKGFSSQNLWRMKQFYEGYKDFPKLSTLLREIPWSYNMATYQLNETEKTVLE